MRLAIPVWENKISPLLDTASRFLIVEVDKRKEVSRYITPVVKKDLYERCMKLKENGVDVLICGAYSKGTLLSPKFSLPGHGKRRE